jgi:hypothetical protein
MEMAMEMVRWCPGGTFPVSLATQKRICFKTVLLFSALGKLPLSTLGKCREDLSVLNKYAFDSSNVSHTIQSRIWPLKREESLSQSQLGK